jgi:tetratricopeptide (TPR) repeat protein
MEDSMPYVRKHGNQVAIVHGERDAETRKVQQRVLFTLYSRPEAEAALGRRETEPPLSFQGIVESEHETLRFNWPKLSARIEELMGGLPDAYDYPSSGVAPALRRGIVAFARGLLGADPQSLWSAACAVQEQRHDLLFLRDLIDWRLSMCDKQEERRFNRDNEYGWRGRVAGKGVTAEAMELLDGLRERGEDDRAVAAAGLLLEVWPDYADAHNLIGDVALERGDYDAALSSYEAALRVGRTLFPKRIAKSRWWSDIDTRPYIRAMRNTTETLLRAGRSAEALAWCDRLEREVFDQDAAAVYRASACLNLGLWSQARELAARYEAIWPSENFVAAFAAFELGDLQDALARWLHATLQLPRSARMLVGIRRSSKPEGHDSIGDHNTGVGLVRTLSTYLKRRRARTFFKRLTTSAEVVSLMEDHVAATQAQRDERGEHRTAYRQLMAIKSPAFARARAVELHHLLEDRP